MIQIPIPDVNDSLTEVDLDGLTYFLRLSWNSEAELWTLSIENAYNELVVAGIAVLPGTPLLSGYRHLTVPAGELVALAPDRRDTIGRAALASGEVALIYVDAQEMADGQI
jgi:hypothetical protein